jgi:hypothetical protein
MFSNAYCPAPSIEFRLTKANGDQRKTNVFRSASLTELQMPPYSHASDGIRKESFTAKGYSVSQSIKVIENVQAISITIRSKGASNCSIADRHQQQGGDTWPYQIDHRISNGFKKVV